MTSLWVTLLAAVAGVVQAHLLVRAAEHKAHPLSFVVRLLVVAVVLVAAASAGHLLWGVVGWAFGFLAAAASAYRRLG